MSLAGGLVTVRHVTPGSSRPPSDLTGEGSWLVVEPAVCFTWSTPRAGGLAPFGGSIWAEWQWIEAFEAEGQRLYLRFRTGAERDPLEFREAELAAADLSDAEVVARACRHFLQRRG